MQPSSHAIGKDKDRGRSRPASGAQRGWMREERWQSSPREGRRRRDQQEQELREMGCGLCCLTQRLRAAEGEQSESRRATGTGRGEGGFAVPLHTAIKVLQQHSQLL